MKVTLRGGPFDGAEVEVDGRAPLLCTGSPVPEGMVARYTRSLDRSVYRFREYDRVVATLPAPGGST